MQIILYNNQSERNAINKNLTNAVTLEGNLREESNIKNPSITVYAVSPINRNYAYIPQFSRYYFISEITSIRNNVWRITLTSDVLMSFRNEILNSYAVIDHTKETQINNYLKSDIWQTLVKDFTDIVNFPSGLLDTGEYILITAGGNS